MKRSILEKLIKFDSLEQLILLLSRADFNEKFSNYINKLILMEKIDWDRFLGLAINHRVNGVIYKKLRGIEGMPQTVRRALHYMHISQKERNRCHRN